MKVGDTQPLSGWFVAAFLVAGAIAAGCSGGGHSSLPAAPSSVTQSVSGTGSAPPGALAITVQLPATGEPASASKRSPQYVSGQTQGVYITGTCLSGGGTVTQNCAGSAFPAVYADVSSGSPLCSGSPRVCTLIAPPVPGYSYAVTVVLLDKTPTNENLSTGYGTGFPTTASMLAVGSNPNPMPAATGSPAPSPTPTALGPRINPGSPNSVTIFLSAIATQFLQVNPLTGGAAMPVGSLTDNAIPVTGNGNYTGLSLYFSAGDADGNLIASPTCLDTYSGEVGSGAGATITSVNFPALLSGPTVCDNWAGPDGKQYALTVTSSLPTHLCTFVPVFSTGTPTPVPTGVTPTPVPCGAAGTSPTTYSNADFAPLINALFGTWQQAPPGVLTTNTTFQWDGVADNDTACSGTTPKCGVPIALSLSNNIPTSAVPLIGKTSSYSVTNASQFYLAPFVTTVSCGTNASCSATTTPSNCIGYCPQVGLLNSGAATVTAFLYGSGGTSNLAGATGCYTSACFSVAVNGSPPVNISQCYTGLNQFTGLANGTANCFDVPDTGTVAGTQPAGTIDCQGPPGSPAAGTTVALIKPGTFTKGSLAPPGVADSMTFTIQAVAGPTTGFCTFEIVDSNRGTPVYSLPIFVQVASNTTIIGVPPSQPLGGSAITGTFSEYAVPSFTIGTTSFPYPISLAVGTDGALWFAENSTIGKIGRITTGGVITSYYAVPTPTSVPASIVSGPDGALWFTEIDGNKIGRLTTAGVMTEYPIPTSSSNPFGIVSGPDGALWFAESAGNKIGRITTTGTISEFPVPTSTSAPLAITLGSDGALWFTEAAGNKIGRITTAGAISEFAIPTSASSAVDPMCSGVLTSCPLAITSGPDGALWFTEIYGNKVGRITTTGGLTEYPIPTSTSGPFVITSGPDGALWFTENAGNKIGRITTAGAFTEFPIPTANSGPIGIITGPDGALWFAEENAANIGRLR